MTTVKTPRQVCGDEVVSHQAPTRDPKRVTGAVLGAVVGGAVGNQIGDGTGQTVATVAGAAAGGYAGSKIQKQMQQGNTYQTTESRCTTVYDSVQKPDGYNVRYRLDGVERTVRMKTRAASSPPGPSNALCTVAARACDSASTSPSPIVIPDLASPCR